MAYAIVQTGTFGVMPTGMKVLGGAITRNTNIRDVTGAVDGGFTRVTGARPTWGVNLQCVYSTGANTYPNPLRTSGVTGISTLFEKVSNITLQRDGKIRNVTGSADALAESEWVLGTKTWSGAIRGWAAQGSTLESLTESGSDIAALLIPLSSAVTLSGKAKIITVSPGMPYARGGPVPLEVSFVYNVSTPGPVVTGTHPLDVDAFSGMAFDLNLGTAWTGVTVIPAQIEATMDYEGGSPTMINLAGPISGSFTTT